MIILRSDQLRSLPVFSPGLDRLFCIHFLTLLRQPISGQDTNKRSFLKVGGPTHFTTAAKQPAIIIIPTIASQDLQVYLQDFLLEIMASSSFLAIEKKKRYVDKKCPKARSENDKMELPKRSIYLSIIMQIHWQDRTDLQCTTNCFKMQ